MVRKIYFNEEMQVSDSLINNNTKLAFLGFSAEILNPIKVLENVEIYLSIIGSINIIVFKKEYNKLEADNSVLGLFYNRSEKYPYKVVTGEVVWENIGEEEGIGIYRPGTIIQIPCEFKDSYFFILTEDGWQHIGALPFLMYEGLNGNEDYRKAIDSLNFNIRKLI